MTLVRGCARCGKDHDVSFKAFERPAEAAPGVVWTHWAACPATGDPILMRTVPKPEAFACKR